MVPRLIFLFFCQANKFIYLLEHFDSSATYAINDDGCQSISDFNDIAADILD